MQRMVITMPQQTGSGHVVRVPVTLVRIPALIDGVKYMESGGVKPPESDTEKRRYRHRGPTLRSLVKLALACESAEEMGQRLRQRFERNARRANADAGASTPQAEAELTERVDRLLAD